MSSPLPPASAFGQLKAGLIGERVLARLWSPGDADALYTAIDESRQHLRPWMAWVDRHQNPGDAAEYITRSLLEFTRRSDIGLGIFDLADNRIVLGATGYHDIDWSVPSFEIGYWATVSGQGRGYVSEAVRLLTDFAFNEFSANRIAIQCDPNNVRSRKVAERLGYHLEGQLRNRARTSSGALRDTLVYSRIPPDPPDIRTASQADG